MNCAEDRSVLNRFSRLIMNGRLAHAYLFAGPAGAGKAATALAVAMLIDCEQNPDGPREDYCGQCPSCVRIRSGNHPDVTVIDSGIEDSIKIAKVREMIGRLQLRPYEARKKVFIIQRIEDLTLEGSNALLKTLEEPARDSLLLLTTEILENNLATIRSRCHTVYFFPLPQGELCEMLRKNGAAGNGEANFLASFSGGYPGRAQYLHAENLFGRKNEIIDRLVFKRDYLSYLKMLMPDKDRIREVLGVLLSLFCDLMLLKTNAGAEQLTHLDRRNELSQVARRYTFEQLDGIIGEIVNTSKLLGENLNVKIPMNLLMEKIWVK